MSELDDVDKKLDKHINLVLSSTLTSAEKQARAVVESKNLLAKWYVVAGTVVMPMAWSALFAMVDAKTQTLWFVSGLVSFGLATGFFLRKIMQMQSPLNPHFVLQDLYETAKNMRDTSKALYQQNNDIRRKAERLDRSVEALSFALSESLIQLEASFASAPPENKAEFDMGLQSILMPLSTDFNDLYGLDGNKAMMTLYLWDERDQKLKIIFRKTKGKIKEFKRTWGKREGFAGVVFADKKTIIETDIGVNDGEVDSNYFEVNGHDREYYRSAIGVPIIASNDEYNTSRDPIGVIVLTSNQNGAFDDKFGSDNRFEAVVSATSHLAAIYIDFVDSNTDTTFIPEVIFGE